MDRPESPELADDLAAFRVDCGGDPLPHGYLLSRVDTLIPFQLNLQRDGNDR